MVLSADRPGAYRFARRHHSPKEILETRYVNSESLRDVVRFLKDDSDLTPSLKTLVVDPFTGVYDKLVEEIAGRGNEIEPQHYQKVNKLLLGFLHSLRPLSVHVVLVAHERLEDGKRGDGKLYPALGGPAMINKTLAEMDIVAHVERDVSDDGVRYMAQVQPRGIVVGKDSTDVLGERPELDLSAWFAAALASDAKQLADIPWEGADAS
jgi:hypothetical protein